MGDLLRFQTRNPRFACRRATPATEHYERGLGLEAVDPAAAITAYQRAIAGRPEFADAHNNLGRVLHDQRQDLASAESHYRIAICIAPAVALYHYNLGVVVEDQHRVGEAVAHYEAALALDPQLADAHWNLARIFELAARRTSNDLMMQTAVRHLTAYRSLARSSALQG